LKSLSPESLTWSIPTISGESPSARRAHSTFVWNDKLYVFGGGDGTHALSDLFALDLMDPSNLRWQNLSPGGPVPVPRGYHTANLVGDKLVVFGGSDGHDCFSDVHVCDLSKFSILIAVYG
jgi:N-acetylneuraminic acid mutarotase